MAVAAGQRGIMVGLGRCRPTQLLHFAAAPSLRRGALLGSARPGRGAGVIVVRGRVTGLRRGPIPVSRWPGWSRAGNGVCLSSVAGVIPAAAWPRSESVSDCPPGSVPGVVPVITPAWRASRDPR
jgi:hypothetical protein